MTGVAGGSREARALRERWTEFLREKNLNTTQQRELIVDQFLRLHEHVSIDELLARVRRRNPKVGYATVYRTLKRPCSSRSTLAFKRSRT